MNKSRLDNPYLLMSILLILWGSFTAISKIALNSLDNFQLQFYMFGFSILIFTVIFAVNGRLKALFSLAPIEISKLLGYGLLYYLYYLLYILSFNVIPVIEASMLNYLFPLLIVLLSVPMLGERLTPLKGLSILLGFAGMLIIVSNGDLTTIRLTNLKGDLLAIGGALSWALFSVLGKKISVPLDLSIYVYTLTAFVLSVISLICFSSFTVPDLAGMSMTGWLGVSNIVLGNLLWVRGLRSASSSLIAVLSYLTPFVTLLFIVMLLGDQLNAAQTIGFLVITVGIAVQVAADKIRSMIKLPFGGNP